MLQTLPTFMEFSYDSNVRYLPMVYLLPEEMIVKCPTLRSLPRKVREVVYDENMLAVVESDRFLKELADAIAALTFPHFGFGGWKEHYTGDFPVWMLSYALPVWARMLKEEIGLDLQMLFMYPYDVPFPFTKADDVKELMGRIVKRAISEEGWQPVLDACRAMPCDEDFEQFKSYVRIDFIRKWYHTRSKKVQMISLDACLEDGEHGIYEIEDRSADFVDKVIAEDFYQRFKARLPEKDMQILALRMDGYTYEEIAVKLGYQNHSGVIKRMQHIRKEYLRYKGEQRR